MHSLSRLPTTVAPHASFAASCLLVIFLLVGLGAAPAFAQVPPAPAALEGSLSYNSHKNVSEGAADDNTVTNDEWSIALSNVRFEYVGVDADNTVAKFNAVAGGWDAHRLEIITNTRTLTSGEAPRVRTDTTEISESGSFGPNSKTKATLLWSRREPQKWLLSISTGRLKTTFTITRSWDPDHKFETEGLSPLFAFSAEGSGITVTDGTVTFDLANQAQQNDTQVSTSGQLVGIIEDKATISISETRMISASVLGVFVNASDFLGKRRVTLTTNLLDRYGTTVTKSQDITPGERQIIEIDLQALGVPRFTENKRISLNATISRLDGSTVTSSQDMVVLLPVVLVPGIDATVLLTSPLNLSAAQGGEGTWPMLEAFLKESSQTLVEFQSAVGEGYRLKGDVGRGLTNYPTLYTLNYDQNYASLAEGAARLRNLILDITDHTYASKVNIVAHSKGGLVSRWYVTEYPEVTPLNVNRFVMCQSPNVGSVWAVVGDSGGLVDPVGLFLPPLPFNYKNLYPLWRWVRQNERQSFGPTPNLELSALNTRQLPLGITYTILYSGNWPTPISSTRFPSVQGTNVSFAPGDFLVPTFSQLGEVVTLINPSVPISLGLIPAFQGVPIERVNISGIHFGYMNSNPEVMQAVFTRLTGDL